MTHMNFRRASFLVTVSDDRLTLQEIESEFDFDNDGILEPASATFEFDKR